MNASLLGELNDAERLLVAETEPAALNQLDEDAVLELHARIRRARDKYIGQYHRGASARVSRKLASQSKAAADEPKAERLAAARAAKTGARPAAAGKTAAPSTRRAVTQKPVGDRALRSPATQKKRASTQATGARRQAKRDSR